MSIALALLIGCSGSPSPQGDAAPAAPPQPPAGAAGPDEAALLKAGPPDPGPAGRAVAGLAGQLGVGVARCPVDGMGRVTQIFGTTRDLVRPKGPTWLTEVSDEELKPWNPTFDIVPVEDKWVSLLAEPGSTGSWLRVGRRTLALTWPEAKKGEVVTCSAVQEVPKRVVTGRVAVREVPMAIIGCQEHEEMIAADGSFVFEAEVPCVLWAEAMDGHRSQKASVPAGDGKHEVTGLEWRADDLQNPDRSWTDKGKAELKEIALKLEDEVKYMKETLSRLDNELAGDEPARKVVERWKNEVTDWERMTQRIQGGIEGKLPL